MPSTSIAKARSPRILVTGATGFVGSVLVPLLIQRYGKKSISLFVLPKDPLRKNADVLDVRIHEGEIESGEAVSRAVQGNDVVIHLAGLISYWRKEKDRLHQVNVEGVRNVVQSCLRHHVKRLIHISSVGAVGFHRKADQLVTEETPFNWPPAFRYMQTKRQGQEIVEKAIREEGLNAVILNPASIMGPGDPDIAVGHNQIYDRIYRSFLFGSFAGGTGIVDVRDLCTVIMSAVTRADITGSFLVVGENVEYAVVIKMIAACAGRRSHAWPVKIPGVILVAVGAFAELASSVTGKRPLVTYASGRLSGWYTCYSNKKTREVFGINYTPFETTIADACRYFERTFLSRKTSP
jgi:dihydroflavonol-4-reductase